MVTTALESRVRRTGEELYARLADDKPSAFRKDYWTGKVIDWSLRDKAFRTQMFRFVDVFPSLETSEQVARHLKQYFDRPELDLAGILEWGVRSVSAHSLAAKLVTRGVNANIRSMAQQFIAGADAKDALASLKKIRLDGAAFSVALLGEAVVSEREADAFAQRYLNTLDRLSQELPRWPPLGSGAGDLDWGAAPRINISVKPSALYSQMRPEAFEHSVTAAVERLRPVMRQAVRQNAFVHFDMEHRSLKNLTLGLYRRLLEDNEFRGYPHTGLALQIYLRETVEDLNDLLDWSRRLEQPLTIRLIKGAYWDAEAVEALDHGWPVPVFTAKADTDVAFEDAAHAILREGGRVRLACGSHNIRSIAYVRELAGEMNVPDESVEYQVLYGMADPIKRALLEMGFPVRLYTPVGELIPGMAYLVRRLLENTSNDSFLRRSFAQGLTPEEALADPRQAARRSSPAAEPPPKSATGFANQPLLDWTITDHRERFQDALAAVRRSFPRRISPLIDGQTVAGPNRQELRNPNRLSETTSIIDAAARAESDQAVAAAERAFAAWRDAGAQQRGERLLQAAEIMRERRFELAALQVFEVGKSWQEADADVCEAIDFLEFYSREALRLSAPQQLGRAPGEDSRLVWEPRGVTAVIAPWNFPLAISTGMSVAALAAGNSVVYKPAPESPLSGWALAEILRDADLPAGVFNFVPGDGPEVGARLVEHPAVAMIAFTGSRKVGLEILRRAAEASAEARLVKHVITEMGGKNAIIVDDDADLDEAVAGVVQSAFSYQGQKCSACSRLILPASIYDRFMARLVAAVESLQLGPAEDPQSRVGAVISAAAKEKIERYIALGKSELSVAIERRFEGGDGHFVPLAVFGDTPPQHPLAQEEIFGPVLAVIRVKDFDEALAVANATDYGLTGAVYSRSPENIAKARDRFLVGNLYINRGSTHALVERHPFGGFKMSGGGSKAGGEENLKQFMVMRTVVENTTRRGFTPEVS